MALNYAGVAFVYPRTEVHVMGPGMDPSGTDQLYTTIRLKAHSLIYVNSLTGIGLPPAQNGVDFNAAQVLTRVRHLLTSPRQPLYYDFLSLPGQTNGLPPSAIINLPDGLDDANGPYPDPDAFSVTYTTPDCLEVTWSCTVKLRDCGFSDTSGPISMRWDDSISFDKYFKATYQRVGTCIISSRSDLKIDDIRRKTIAPRVGQGFQRVKSSYTISRDGLRCDFMFTDEQIRFAPPYPCVDMELIQSETFPLLGGMRMGEVSVNMVGVQNANVRDLAMWALTVAKGRVWAANPLQSTNGTVVNGPSPPIIRTRETNSGVECAVIIPYKSPPKKKQENQSGPSNAFWGGLIGLSFGGPVGSFFGSGIGSLFDGNAKPTPEGRDPTKVPVFPWIGYGTSPAGPQNPIGYANWAFANGSINAPADGVSLAPAVALFAALLEDPCGATLTSTPYAPGTGATIRTEVNSFNTELCGIGGPPAIKNAQLTASLSVFNASQYSQIPTSANDTSLYEFDEKAGVYDHWQCLSEYHDDPGIIVMPTGNPNGKNIAIQHSSNMKMLRKRWSACRTGAAPIIPPKDLGIANFIYVGGMIAPRELKVAPDGVSIQYEVSGVYEYQALDPTLVEETAAIPPFLSSAALHDPSKWLGGEVELHGGSTGGGISFLPSGGGSPLGSGSLINNPPP